MRRTALIAVYKGNKYKFVLNKRRKGIITRCVQKTDGSFFKENDIYYKPLDEKDLSDIYAVEFYVFFDTGFKDVSTWWKITEADLLDNKVKLRFAEGILPGWDIEERNVCTKEVHFNEISCTKVKFVFEQIGGKEENVIKEKTKSWNETLKDIKKYGAL